MVIARNSTFVYKGKAVDIKQVGLDQGVRYVLEGSVRKSGKRVRITAQLIDTTTGHHQWAERYDRDLEDIFTLQNEITIKIVSALDVHFRPGEQVRLWSSGTENLEAWECVRLGSDLLRSYRAEDVHEAMLLLQRAIDLDPEYATAWVILADCHFLVEEDARYSKDERKQALELMRECAQRALQYDPSCAEAYAVLGLYHLTSKEYDKAIHNANKSVDMAPNHAINIATSAIILNKCGQPERALERIRKAMRLCPVYPIWFLSTLGQIFRGLGKIDEAIDAYSELICRDPDSLEGHVGLAEILGEADRTEKAMISTTEILRVNPNFSISEYVSNLAYRDLAEIKRFSEGLRKAGLPE